MGSIGDKGMMGDKGPTGTTILTQENIFDGDCISSSIDITY